MTCSRMCHGLTPEETRGLPFSYAEAKNKGNIPDPWKIRSAAGKDWLTGFLKHSETLSIIKPDATRLGRSTSLNWHTVNKFFANLKESIAKNDIQSGRIWDVDETKITTVHNPPKIVGDKKMKQLGQVTTAELGVLVTGVSYVGSAGLSIPPAYGWPRKTDRNIANYMRGTPRNSLGQFHESGWMTNDNFVL